MTSATLERPATERSTHHATSVPRRGPTIPTVGLVALFLYALDAWVVQVEGESSFLRRILYLIALAIAGVATWYVSGRSSSRARAGSMLVIGLVGLVVTAPIVFSHIAKLGPEGNSLTGLLAVVGSLALVVTGTTRLVTAARSRWRKLLAIPIALIVAQFFVLPVGLAVYTTQAARPPLPDRTPATLGMGYEDVTVTAADGTALAGWYVESTNGAAIVLRHGSGSTRANVLQHAAFLADAGYGVLMLDARGHGESEGRINELGWHGPDDIEAAVDYLATRPDVSMRIGALGLSMGGEEVLNAASTDERIEAVVSEGAGIGNFNDSVANGGHAVARLVNWTQFAFVDLLSDASQPEGIANTIGQIAPRPVLLITGDDAAEETMGPVYTAAGSSVALWHLSDTPHTDGLRVHPSEYKKRVIHLFDEALLDAS